MQKQERIRCNQKIHSVTRKSHTRVCMCVSGAGPGPWASLGPGRTEENKGLTVTENMWATLMSNQSLALSIVV